MSNSIQIKEHEYVADFYHHCFDKDKLLGYLSYENRDYNQIHQLKYLGLESCRDKIKSSYYVGAVWVNKDTSLIVKPKIDNLNFIEIFAHCYNCDIASKYISEIYHVLPYENPIRVNDTFHIDVTPLIIIHYLSLIKKIVSKGLKRNFVSVTENLCSKVKGKIIFSSHVKKNILNNRFDRAFCKYTDYSINNIENQILKKALIFSARVLSNYKHSKLNSDINRFLNSFYEVDDIKVNDSKLYKINPLFKDYSDALHVAMLILKRFDYELDNCNHKDEYTQPFWIDMPRLFELYSLSLLSKKYKNVLYQVGSRVDSGFTDILLPDEKIIIDVKYKTIYESNKKSLDDIRQLSGYARTKNILKKIGIPEEQYLNMVPNCLIVYPSRESNLDSICINDKIPMNRFVNFYKCGVRLPTI